MGSGNKSGRSNIGCCDEAEETIACDVGLGLKMMQQHHTTTESSSYPVLNNLSSNSMSDNYNRNHAAPDSSFLSGYFGSGDGGAFGRGRGGNRNFLCGNTHMFDAVSTPPSGGGGRAGGIASSGQRTLPAAAASSQFNSDASFKSPWGTRAFTEAQRQELERQTVIYKYMVACVPVPPELLSSSISYVRNHRDSPFNCRSSTSSSGWTGTGAVGNKSNGTVELRFASSNDPEPWRCRRTDGKKWRCSRDVAPDQKYCERHSHKGRPSRSRKPVESSLGINHHRPRPNISPVPENLVLLNSSLSAPTSSSATFVPLQFSVTSNNNNDNDNNNNNSSMFKKQNQGPPSFLNQTALISPTQCNHFRYPTPTTISTPTTSDWFMKRTPTAVPASLPATVPVPVPAAAAAAAAASLYPQIQLGQFPLTQPRDDPSDFNHKYGSLFHDSRSREMGSTSTDQNSILPRQFLDTWSSLGNERDGIGQITSTSKSISSSLTLSMSGGRTDDRVSAGLGIGLFDSQRDGGGDADGDQGMVQQDFNWMINSGSSWMTSAPPGGPLAEALCLGISSSSGRGGSGDGDGEASPMGPSSSGRTSSSGGGNGALN